MTTPVAPCTGTTGLDDVIGDWVKDEDKDKDGAVEHVSQFSSWSTLQVEDDGRKTFVFARVNQGVDGEEEKIEICNAPGECQKEKYTFLLNL